MWRISFNNQRSYSVNELIHMLCTSSCKCSTCMLLLLASGRSHTGVRKRLSRCSFKTKSASPCCKTTQEGVERFPEEDIPSIRMFTSQLVRRRFFCADADILRRNHFASIFRVLHNSFMSGVEKKREENWMNATYLHQKLHNFGTRMVFGIFVMMPR